jgi:glycosyltransferase involved in cell wall biosynthesis
VKIAFDQQVFLLQEYGGISRYICSLANELVKIDDVDARIFAPLHFNRNLSSMKSNSSKALLLPKLNPKLFRLAILIGTFWARNSINSFRPDILHETYFSLDDYCSVGAKKVLTVYDMIHEKYADSFEGSEGTSNPKRIATQRADHVICISESTRQDLINICQISIEKTSVIYLGVDSIFCAVPQDTDMRLDLPKNFILYVGKRDGYKNFAGFLNAFVSSPFLKENYSVVCFGGGKLSVTELALGSAAGLRSSQLLHYSGGDDLLASIYRQADALVYPSLYEGFGLPPLEAMASGCPVICSNTSSLPEVVGTAGEYFDPTSQESMMEAMERVMISRDRRVDLISKGYKQAAKFSWERCAQETLGVYRKLL